MITGNKAISCCFSGHRTAFFDMDNSYLADIMREALETAITGAIAQGFTIFYSGMAMGFDIIAAEMIIRHKQATAAEISLICVVPFSGQEIRWRKKWRTRHDDVLRAADSIRVLNDRYIRGCYHERNRYLVDNSARLICLYGDKAGGTKHTYDYAEKSGLEIVNIWQVIQNQEPLN